METCKHCGKTWGVTTPPRPDIACHDCQFRRPDLYPVRYWEARRAALSYMVGPLLKYRSPAWHDWQTSMEDLAYTIECAEKLEASR